jgi:hypothetical protein
VFDRSLIYTDQAGHESAYRESGLRPQVATSALQAAIVVFGENDPSPDFASCGTRQGRFVRRRGAQCRGRRAPARFPD